MHVTHFIVSAVTHLSIYTAWCTHMHKFHCCIMLYLKDILKGEGEEYR